MEYATCVNVVSQKPHDTFLHYFGCAIEGERDQYLKSLSNEDQRLIQEEELRIARLRSNLEEDKWSLCGRLSSRFKRKLHHWQHQMSPFAT